MRIVERRKRRAEIKEEGGTADRSTIVPALHLAVLQERNEGKLASVASMVLTNGKNDI